MGNISYTKSRIYPEYRAYETRLAIKDSFSNQGPRERVFFKYNEEVGPKISSTAEGEASPLGGQLE